MLHDGNWKKVWVKMNFESIAEQKAYPVINTLCIQNNLFLKYQQKIGLQRWGYKSKEEYCFKNDLYYDYDESNWKDTSFVFEEFRIDFAIFKTIDEIRNHIIKMSKLPKLAVEIDGEKWHSVYDDQCRDNELEKYGFKVVRFAAKLVLEKPYEFRKQLEIKIKEFKND